MWKLAVGPDVMKAHIVGRGIFRHFTYSFSDALFHVFAALPSTMVRNGHDGLMQVPEASSASEPQNPQCDFSQGVSE